MNNTQKVFIELVKAGLWDTDVQLSHFGKIDFIEILRFATEQGVAGVVAEGMECVTDLRIPQTEVLQFVGLTLQIEHKNKAMNQFVAELVERICSADINVILIKGQGIAQCYEKPLWRSSGDVDLFSSEDCYVKVKELLLPLSSSTEEELVWEKHLGMTIKGWIVELHGHLYSGLSSRVDKELDRLQKDTFYGGKLCSWMNGKTQIFLLNAENNAFYVFTHILQHFYKEGVGLRQICDWCRLLYTYRASLNFDLLEHRIRRAGLMTEWKAFGALAIEFLGMPIEAMPFYSISAKWKRKAELIMEFVMKSGNMGNNRDMSHFSKKPYLIRKLISMGRRIGDLINHARIFPMDSLRFFPRIMFNGVRSALRGE